ncbi:hypothetical protein [Nostoc sp.]
MPQALRCANTSRRDSWKPTWVRWFTSCYNGGKYVTHWLQKGRRLGLTLD